MNKIHQSHSQLLVCEYCGRICKNLSGKSFHQNRCKENPMRIPDQLRPKRIGWSKGLTKETYLGLARISELMKRKFKEDPSFQKEFRNALSFLGKLHSEETKKKISASVSKSRIEGYANGTITPAKGVGKGKYSHFVYNGKNFF